MINQKENKEIGQIITTKKNIIQNESDQFQINDKKIKKENFILIKSDRDLK